MKILCDVMELHQPCAQEINFYHLLSSGQSTSKKYAEIIDEAKRIAAYLQVRFEYQSRVLLIYSPGLDFISAFVACLYSGMIAVPAYPLQNPRQAYRLHAIIDSCDPKLILGNQKVINDLSEIESLQNVEKIATESLLTSSEVIDFKMSPAINESTLALLQYTSGSTGKPKGVMVSHGNLMSNLSSLKTGWGLGENKTTVMWLPFQHDLGLIGGVLSSLYNKNDLIMLPPVSVIEKPYRWLKALSDFKAYFTAGPNFAYQLCANKVSDEELATLDLSSVGYALAAAEPNRYETMEQFCTKFASCGFKKEAYSVGYGLAENTLHVTTNAPGKKSQYVHLSKAALAQGKIYEDQEEPHIIMSAGALHPEHEVAIVNPETKMRCPSDEVGEIWVHSHSVAQGYWANIEATKECFNAIIAGEEKTYLRTGDLGFIKDSELYVTGRLKDLLIIDGRNIYPQDIEAAVDACDSSIKPGCSAAFSVDTGIQESLVVCVEIKRTEARKDLGGLLPAIRHAIAQKFEIAVHDVKLLKPNGSFKTTSGKIQRKATKKAYLENTLNCLSPELTLKKNQQEADTLAADLHQILAEVLGIKNIAPNQRFSELGGTSIHATLFYNKLQEYLGPKIPVSQTIAFDYPTLSDLIEYAQQALLKCNDAAIKTQLTTINNSTKIAIIGIGCRLPGKINSIDSLWSLISSGNDAIEPIPNWRWEIDHYEDELKNRISQAGILENIDQFDAAFFNISPKEARQMDPQHRLLLEIAWESLENAAIPPSQLDKEKIGIYIGSSSTDYRSIISKNNNDADIDSYFVLDNASSAMAGRIAYYLGTQGPAETIDTACSSSLVALNEACQCLQMGKINMALAGGVNIILYPENSVGLARANMLSPTNRCHTFSQAADGYVRAEGCVLVVLKRLDDALKDKDMIHAVIQSTVVNQDGASSGLTVPSLNAQKSLLQEALKEANLSPNDIDYIEAHGSATVLGDPIEFGAINAVFSNQERPRPLYVGSVKANLGHLEAAAGIAGLLKTVAALQHQELPANHPITAISNKLDLNITPIEIAQINSKWHSFGRPRRAGVSSFGFSGTNAHVILEEAPLSKERDEVIQLPQEHVFVLSAKSRKSLEGLIEAYKIYLNESEASLADICYTASMGRSHFSHRVALIVESKENLLAQLSASELACYEAVSSDEVVESSDLDALLVAYREGKAINWASYYAPYVKALRKVNLPNYQFDRQRYWLDIKKSKMLRYGVPVHELLGARLPGYSEEIHFLNELSAQEPDYLSSQVIFGEVIFPVAGYIESALAAGCVLRGGFPIVLEEVRFLRPLRLATGASYEYQLSLMPAANGYDGRIDAQSHEYSEWNNYATFHLDLVSAASPWVTDLATLKSGMRAQTVDALYAGFAQAGLEYGPEFQVVREAYAGAGKALVLVELHAGITPSGYWLHPTLLDGAFQSISLLVTEYKTYLPSMIRSLRCYQACGSRVWVLVDLHAADAHSLTADLTVYDEHGVMISQIEGFSARATDKHTLQKLIMEQGRQAEVYIETFEPYTLPVTEFSAVEVLFLPKKWSDIDWSAQHVVLRYEDNLNEVLEVAQRALKEPPRSLILLVHQAFAVGEMPVLPAQRGALGFWRTLSNELSQTPCYLIDLGGVSEADARLYAMIHEGVSEHELIVRDGCYYVPRLYREAEALRRAKQLPAPGIGLYLESAGGIDTLHWAARSERVLAPEQVRVRIDATALNFRDVLNAMDLYPGDARYLGIECAGEIIEVGSAVMHWSVGTRIVAVGQGLFGREAILDAAQLCTLPEVLSPIQGAALPIAFLTADYALNHLAHLQKGQKILIHAATGGVGMAAIELARLAGAEIYATASAAKQAYVREELGITRVYDSRRTDFGEQILNDTNGLGMDVVLNSLTSEGFIESSLKCLKPQGFFLEIGKKNIYSMEQMQEARPDVHYHIVDLPEPALLQKGLQGLLDLFAQGQLTPLPVTEFAVRDTIEAFHYLQQARHMGKVVIRNPQPFVYRPGATYLITGGTGGLGLALAEHLIAQGVRHLVVTSRHEPGEAFMAWMKQQDEAGITVRHYLADAADESALAAVLHDIAQSDHALKGVFHAAGVLRDGLLLNLTPEDFDTVLAPKVLGSQHLDKLTRDVDLDCFVLFSSIASLLGSPGQGNYAAANGFMDGLAQARQALGLPALSVHWGPFAAVGMAAQLSARHKAQGFFPLDVTSAFKILDGLLSQTNAEVAVLQADWNKLSRRENPYLSSLVSAPIAHKGVWLSLLEAAPAAQRGHVLMGQLKQLLAQVLSLHDARQLDTGKGFFELGIDSLMAVELKNKIQQQVGDSVTLSNTLAFDYANLNSLRDYLLEQLRFKEKIVRVVKKTHLLQDEPIAIIGMSVDFPGAPNLEAFRTLLHEGGDGVSEVPKTRWDIDAYYDPDPKVPGKSITRRGGFIHDIDRFDASFFSISPKEATYLDPQHRLLLTHTWQALEHAGIAPQSLVGSDTGVFVGISSRDYGDLIIRYGAREAINAYISTGNASSTASGRISYTLGLEGPNFAIDTACSSSLVALNEACERIKNSDCRLAIVGGVNALLTPEMFINLSKAGMLSPDGQCKTFDERADGYVRGEGCGVVVLKRLSEAMTDNDCILAVIKASGINQDGASSGLTVPNGPAQERLLAKVLEKAGLAANDIDYVECHGTGTSLGDPIEVHALVKVYGENRTKPLYLGSVKTNIGHLEAAAGIASLIKTVLALNAEQIPPHLHFEHLNPHIQLDFSTEIVTAGHAWARSEQPRRAGVSSFGFSGTNAHVILEEGPPNQERDQSHALPENQLFVLSAKSRKSLEALIEAYKIYLNESEASLADICYTASMGRSHFSHRLALIVESKENLLAQLSASELACYEVASSDEVVESSDLDALLVAYREGKAINWASYYAPYVKALRKVNLPNYQFDRQRYWLDITKTNEDECLPDECYYELLWQQEESVSEATNLSGMLWVINNDVAVDWTFSDKDMKLQLVDSRMLMDLEKLPQELLGVIYIAPGLPKATAMSYQQQYAHDFLALAQHLAKKQEKGTSFPLGLTLITKNAQHVRDDDQLAGVNSSPLGGMIKALQWEAPELHARWIDTDDLSHDALSSRLRAANHSLLALRQGLWYSPTIQQAMLSTLPTTFDTSGLHWITGGTGGLGFALAQYLVARGVNELLLSSRRGETSELAVELASLREQGISIEVCALDSADERAVKALIEAHQHQLKAIYHLAGVEHSGSWIEVTPERLNEVFLPKIAGADMLDRLTKSIPLNYFVLFSSISSVLGSNRQLAYLSANQYLDALAFQRKAQGKPVTCVNWGPWGEVGMITRKKGDQQVAGLLKPEAAFAALDRLLSNHQSGISIVMPHYLPFMLSFIPKPRPKALGVWLCLLEQEEAKARRSQLAQDLLTLNPELRHRRLTELVTHTLQTALGLIDQPSVDKNFFELGMNSLMSVEMGYMLQDRLGIILEPGMVINYPYISKLVDYLEIKLKENLHLLQDHDKKINTCYDLPYSTIEPLRLGEFGYWNKKEQNFMHTVSFSIQINTERTENTLRQIIAEIVINHSPFWFYFDKKYPLVKFTGIDETWSFPIVDLTNEKPELQESLLQKYYVNNHHNNRIRKYTPPLITATLFKLKSNQYEIQLHVAHVIFDLTSVKNLIREYNNKISGMEPSTLSAEQQLNEFKLNARSKEFFGNGITFCKQFIKNCVSENHDLLFLKKKYRNAPINLLKSIELTNENRNKLTELVKIYNCSLNHMVFVIFSIAIGEIFHSDKFDIKFLTAGRSESNLSFMGDYTLITRLCIEKKENAASLVKSILEQLELKEAVSGKNRLFYQVNSAKIKKNFYKSRVARLLVGIIKKVYFTKEIKRYYSNAIQNIYSYIFLDHLYFKLQSKFSLKQNIVITYNDISNSIPEFSDIKDISVITRVNNAEIETFGNIKNVYSYIKEDNISFHFINWPCKDAAILDELQSIFIKILNDL